MCYKCAYDCIKCFHIQTVGEMLEINIRCAKKQADSDYIPIAIAETYEEIKKKRDKFTHLPLRNFFNNN